MTLKNRTLLHILEENYARATVFEVFGIDYAQQLDKSLANVSETYGIELKNLIDALKHVKQTPPTFNYDFLEIPVLVAYLKNTHHEYARTKIPHIAKNLEKGEVDPVILQAFTRFSKDLKKHMLLEEKVIFPFIEQLYYVSGSFDAAEARKLLEENSTDLLCASHTQDDDEMKELRTLTNRYAFSHENHICLKIAMNDLKNLEQDIHLHAKIEDSVLFEKAKMAENHLKERIRINTRSN